MSYYVTILVVTPSRGAFWSALAAGNPPGQNHPAGGTTVNSTLADIQALGYTENEAKAYLALLAHPEISGYEISRHSGVPRAKVYEVMDGLVAKGAAMEAVVDGRRIFRPVSHLTLLDRYRTEAASRLDRLQDSLATSGARDRSSTFFTLTGLDAILARCREEINGTRFHLFVSMWDEQVEALAPSLTAASGRGVHVHAVVLGDHEKCRIAGVPVHTGTSPNLRPRQVMSETRWLLVTGDRGSLVLAEIRVDRASALCVSGHVASVLGAQWVANDIFVCGIRERLGTPSVLRVFSPDEIRRIERMWTDAWRLLEVPTGEEMPRPPQNP